MDTATPETEYESKPRLALLAAELEVLNRHLIAENVADRVRLARLRQFAEASRKASYIQISNGHNEGEPFMCDDLNDLRPWRIELHGKLLGHFENPFQAREAHRLAHIAKFGTNSRFHPDHPPTRGEEKYQNAIRKEARRVASVSPKRCRHTPTPIPSDGGCAENANERTENIASPVSFFH